MCNSRPNEWNGLKSSNLPAVNHYWPSMGRIQRFDFLQEFQHPNGCERHSEIGPAGEVKLCDEPQRFTTIMQLQGTHRLSWPSHFPC